MSTEQPEPVITPEVVPKRKVSEKQRKALEVNRLKSQEKAKLRKENEKTLDQIVANGYNLAELLADRKVRKEKTVDDEQPKKYNRPKKPVPKPVLKVRKRYDTESDSDCSIDLNNW